MRKIEVVDTFIHEGNRYEREEVRSVDDRQAYYFVGHGWAKFADNPDENESVFDKLEDGPVDDLQIDNIIQESK